MTAVYNGLCSRWDDLIDQHAGQQTDTHFTHAYSTHMTTFNFLERKLKYNAQCTRVLCFSFAFCSWFMWYMKCPYFVDKWNRCYSIYHRPYKMDSNLYATMFLEFSPRKE